VVAITAADPSGEIRASRISVALINSSSVIGGFSNAWLARGRKIDRKKREAQEVFMEE
jgi:hypothetical protein